MTLYIDADACPVKAEAERVATRLGVTMVLVSNGGIRPSANPLVISVPDVPTSPVSTTTGASVVPSRRVTVDRLPTVVMALVVVMFGGRWRRG